MTEYWLRVGGDMQPGGFANRQMAEHEAALLAARHCPQLVEIVAVEVASSVRVPRGDAEWTRYDPPADPPPVLGDGGNI